VSPQAVKTKTWEVVGGRAGRAKRFRIAFVALGLALAACAVGPQYKGPPQSQLTELHNAAPVAARPTDIPSPPVETWWTGFRDPVLTRIVERALAQNLDLAAAVARGDQARLAIAQTQVETDTRLLELVRLRFSRGASAEKEVAQAEALLAQARATIPPLRTALEAQLNRLDVLMGAQPGTYAAELAKPEEIPGAPGLPPGQNASDLLRRRPDIIAAERRLAASNARIGVAVSEYYPKVSLSALLGFESLSSGRLFSAESFQPQATAGLRWRLFDFGRVDAEVAQANSANAQALLVYRQTVLRATEDVENAFMALAQLELQSRDLANEVDALARARDASQESYLAGASSLTDVLDADRQSLVAQDELARTRADTDRAAVLSFRALGGGWSM
jgi:NodT family efflux transporter outer membrane factor (OMF) lipoprotein